MIIHGLLLEDAHRTPELGWVRIDADRIAEIGYGTPSERPAAGGPSAVITPGFIDAHLHLPQMDVRGCDGMDLLDWLSEIVYPAEMKWEDAHVAEAKALEAHRRMLRAGTLGYAGYLTSHFHSVAAVVQAGRQVPLRAIVGQVLMDRNAPRELLVQESEHQQTRLGEMERGRESLSINPRFALSCSEELLALAGRKAYGGAVVQTHLAETLRESEITHDLFPDDPNETAVFNRHGLLTDRTLLAHCVHLDETQWKLIARRGCIAVHCPAANTFLESGLFDLDAARAHEVRVALGTDVAAGPDLAMPRAARAMIEVAKTRSMIARVPARVHVPSPADVWGLITRGNAEALGFRDMGRLEAGAAADLLVLEPPFNFDEYLIGRLIYTWRDEYIAARVLNGKLIESDWSA